MKKNDILFAGLFCLLFAPFFLSRELYEFYLSFNKTHGLITSFVKFALLATMGESLGLRIRTGTFNKPGFGLIPRAIVWGFLGIAIKAAFVIFSIGTLDFLSFMGMKNTNQILAGNLTSTKVLAAFCISFFMNLIFAPIMMTAHKVTDTHIENTGGTIKGLLSPIPAGKIISSLNWEIMWGFVFKKTIPLFWIPAHTITFLLPPDFRVLFAALLGIVLGVILAVAAIMSKE